MNRLANNHGRERIRDFIDAVREQYEILVQQVHEALPLADLIVIKDVTRNFGKKYSVKMYKPSKQVFKLTKYKGTEAMNKTINVIEFSHSIKAPAITIIGFSKLLLRGEFGKLNQEQKGYISDIMVEAEKLTEMAQKLVDTQKGRKSA